VVFVCFWSIRRRVISPLSSSNRNILIIVGFDSLVSSLKVSIVTKVSPRSHLMPCHHLRFVLAWSSKLRNTTTTLGSPQCCQSKIALCKHIQPLFAVSFAIFQPFCYLGVVGINEFFDALTSQISLVFVDVVHWVEKKGWCSGADTTQNVTNNYDTLAPLVLCPLAASTMLSAILSAASMRSSICPMASSSRSMVATWSEGLRNGQ